MRELITGLALLLVVALALFAVLDMWVLSEGGPDQESESQLDEGRND
jgi:hypothetical protein